ncbi:hypothetical protein D3C86_2119100 [compost metagenome]
MQLRLILRGGAFLPIFQTLDVCSRLANSAEQLLIGDPGVVHMRQALLLAEWPVLDRLLDCTIGQ